MDKHQLAHIESGLKELRDGLAALAHDKPIEELLRIIHKPGWTTLAEVTMVAGLLDSMLLHTRALTGLKQALLTGAEAVALNPQPLPPRS